MLKEANVLNLPQLDGPNIGTSQAYAYQRLRHALMVGAIQPGIAITIQEIAEALEISATPVRESLRQLSSEKALLTLKNRRIKVPEMTEARLEELIELRCTIEVYAAKRALPYISTILVDELQQIDLEMDAAVERNDWPSIVTLNQKFHTTLYQANPNQVAMPMIESCWLQLGPFMRVAVSMLEEIYLVDRHKEAIEALRRNDALNLGMAIEADIRDGVGRLKFEMIEEIILKGNG